MGNSEMTGNVQNQATINEHYKGTKKITVYFYDTSNDVPVRVSSTNPIPISNTTALPSTSSVTSVNDTASSTTLLSSNTSRKEAVIQNDSDQVLYVKFGTTATATDYTARLIQYGILTTTYTGRIDGIWAANSTGAAKITELT